MKVDITEFRVYIMLDYQILSHLLRLIGAHGTGVTGILDFVM